MSLWNIYSYMNKNFKSLCHTNTSHIKESDVKENNYYEKQTYN